MKQAIGLLFFRVVFQQYLLSVCISLLLFLKQLWGVLGLVYEVYYVV